MVAKVEYFNPGGSIKDRIAVAMIEAAEESGALRPGGTIVEPTSGNTGVGLAIAANQRGYSCVFVCPDKVSQDKIAGLRAFGARVEVCPTSVAPRIRGPTTPSATVWPVSCPDAWKPDQYSNAANPAAHYRTTGPELWEEPRAGSPSRDRDRHRRHHLGSRALLKEVSGGRVKVIGADPVGSVYSGGAGRPYLVEGVGEDFWPDAYDRDVADEIIAVTDREAFTTTRRLAVEHGLLVGGSSGMAAAAAARVASKARPDDLVVVILPDGGRGYLSKVFDDEWMRAFGFLRAQDGVTVREVLAAREQRLPTLIHIHPNETIRDAINLFHEFDVSQVPVLTAEPPVVISEVVGSVSEQHLLDLLFRGEADLADPIREHIGPPLPTCGVGEPIRDAIERLAARDALLVVCDGAPCGIITRQDALSYLSARDCDG